MKTISRVVALFGLLLSSNLNCISQTLAPTALPIPKTGDPIVFSTTVVNGKGDLVTEVLPRANFRVLIDGKPADTIDLRQEYAPISVGILVDASGSIRDSGKKARALFETAQQALRIFFEKSNQSNEYFLLAFNEKPQLLVDWTSNANAILDALGVLRAKGNTALYDAVYLGTDKVRNGRHSKKILILITDGADNVSTYSFDQVRDQLRKSDVLVYAVGIFGVVDALGMRNVFEAAVLNYLSRVSGGWCFQRKDGKPLAGADAVSAFETLAQELRHQYTVTLKPSASPVDRKWHKVKVNVTSPSDGSSEMSHLSARTREGFYWNQR